MEELKNELQNLKSWFDYYDTQTIQYQRDIRNKGESEINIILLDNIAYNNAIRIKEIEGQLEYYYKNL